MQCKKCGAGDARRYVFDTDIGLYEAEICRPCYDAFIEKAQAKAAESGVTLQPIVAVGTAAGTPAWAEPARVAPPSESEDERRG
jgi:hypothetical protein